MQLVCNASGPIWLGAKAWTAIDKRERLGNVRAFVISKGPPFRLLARPDSIQAGVLPAVASSLTLAVHHQASAHLGLVHGLLLKEHPPAWCVDAG